MWLLAVALAVSVSVVVPSARVEPVRAAYPSANMPSPASAILELNTMNCDKDVQYVIIPGARRNSPLCSRASSKLRCGDRQNNQRQPQLVKRMRAIVRGLFHTRDNPEDVVQMMKHLRMERGAALDAYQLIRESLNPLPTETGSNLWHNGRRPFGTSN